MVQINAGFDSGNIEVRDSTDVSNIQLAIQKDHNSDFYQWFHFCLSGAKGQACAMHLQNAAGAAYVDGWKNYQAVASYDRQHWFRVESGFDGQVLSIYHTPEYDAVWFAYFAPYSMERHHDLIAKAQGAQDVSLEVLGQTLDGQMLDMLHFASTAKQPKKLWLIARQHPGETMAEWWMEGFLARMLDDCDPVVREIRARAALFIVPNMNPDGSRRGHLRTNAAGANLNREWLHPDMKQSPEVYLVREKMRATGMDFCLDVHGDEALPFNFIAGAEGIPDWKSGDQVQLDRFKQTYARISPDFQTEKGYELDAPGLANMSMCTNWTAQEFGCLSMTLEMPFKDTEQTPDHEQGWSPLRCRHLGSAMVDTIWARFEEI